MEYCSALTCYALSDCSLHSVTCGVLPISFEKDDEQVDESRIKIFVSWKERGLEDRMETLEVTPSDSLLTLREQVADAMRVQASAVSLFLGNPPKMSLDQFMEAEDVTVASLLHPMSCITAKLAATSSSAPQSHSKDIKENSIDWVSLLSPNPSSFKEKVLFDKAVLVEKLLSDEECEKLIRASESLGYDPIDYNPKYRSNTRAVILNQPLADKLYPRVQACQNIPKCVVDPQTGHRWHMIGLNPSFRFCRYLPPQHFSAHCDGAFQASEDEVTWYTINFYLNSGFQGGKTRFFVFPRETKLVPRKPKVVAPKKPVQERSTLSDFLKQKKQNSSADSSLSTSSVSTTSSSSSASSSLAPSDLTPETPAPIEYDEVEVLLTASELTERGPSHSVAPDTGLALIFDHWSRSYLHDGAPLEQGVKYIVRTDVLYKRLPLGQICDCS